MTQIIPLPFTVKDTCVVCRKPIEVKIINRTAIKKYCSEDCQQIAGAVRKVDRFLQEKGLSFAKLERRLGL